MYPRELQVPLGQLEIRDQPVIPDPPARRDLPVIPDLPATLAPREQPETLAQLDSTRYLFLLLLEITLLVRAQIQQGFPLRYRLLVLVIILTRYNGQEMRSPCRTGTDFNLLLLCLGKR